jgi:putative ABC transport system substrate-binding protein
MSYGKNFREIWREATYFVDRMLKGTSPADLPMEIPTKFDGSSQSQDRQGT